jgi:hypothetical protein
MTRWFVCFCAFALGTVAAQPNPAELFPQQAEVFVDSAGLSRLELSNEVLTQVAADLSDLRLFDAQGSEVPYSLEAGLPELDGPEFSTLYSLTTISADRSTAEPERGQTRYREVYTLQLDQTAPLEGRWQLRLEHAFTDFVRRIDVDAIEPGGTRVELLREASFFWLQSGRVYRRTFDLSSLPSRTIEVAIEGDGGSFITPRIELANSRVRRVVPREAPLSILRQSADGPWTELELERPRGLTVIGLRFTTSTPTFVRSVQVLDRVAGSPDRRLDDARPIFRVPAQPPAENLEIQVRPAMSDRLIVRILNQDSPPLADLTVTALAAKPALLFTLSPGASGSAAGMLRFGGGRAAPRRYDLGSLQGVLLAAAGRVGPAEARLGPINENVDYSAGPLLAFASRPGAAIDGRSYSYLRRIQLTPSTEGLSRVGLSIEDAARCRADFADIRLVDGNSAQWAYLLDPNARQVWLPLALAEDEDADEATEYRLELPAQPATLDRLRLDFENEFFDRPYQLFVTPQAGPERIAAAGRLSRTEISREPLEIEFAATRATVLRLVVSDGNDRPLASPKAEGRFLLPDLYTVAPAGDYRMLMGFPDDRPPVYELAQASSTVLAARADAATLGEIIENPLFSASSRLRTGPGSQRALFWIALLAAVGVLAVMTLKTVRGEAGDAS